MALPRLTGTLRSFSNVTKHEDYSEELADLRVKIFFLFQSITVKYSCIYSKNGLLSSFALLFYESRQAKLSRVCLVSCAFLQSVLTQTQICCSLVIYARPLRSRCATWLGLLGCVTVQPHYFIFQQVKLGWAGMFLALSLCRVGEPNVSLWILSSPQILVGGCLE